MKQKSYDVEKDLQKLRDKYNPIVYYDPDKEDFLSTMKKAERIVNSRTLFGPRRYEKYSSIVKMKNLDDAENSIRKLRDEFVNANTRAKEVRIIRVLNQASNIASVMANNMRNSAPVRSEKREISQMFRKSQRDLSSTMKSQTRID
jgi:hypothetical protein